MEKIEHFPNIRRYREAKGISIEEVSKKARLPVKQYEQIESGKSILTSDVLFAISKALKVSGPKLTYYDSKLQSVRFRSNQKLKDRKFIILEVEHWLNEYKFIENLMEDFQLNLLEEISRQVKDEKINLSESAVLTREKFGLSENEPVSNIAGVLESNGIKVGEHVVKSHDFFGLSVSTEDGGPAIVVNTWKQIPVERWIFTAAHELGHLVLHQADFNVLKFKEGKSHEKEANAFASEFLMPKPLFSKVWKEFRGMSFVERVLTVKRIFRVSYKTVLYRYATLNPNSTNVWVRFKSDYKKLFEKAKFRNLEAIELTKDEFTASFPEFSVQYEPDSLSCSDFNCCRFVGLVRTALEEHKISFGRAAEILQISRQELRDIANTW